MQLTTIRSTGLGELTVVQFAEDVLAARGLGSCVGISAYERTIKLSIMAHVMLPGPAPEWTEPDQPARYAAQAVKAVVATVEKYGGRTRDLVIKLAGGAQVIRLLGKEDRLQVGQRNIAAVREALAAQGLRVAAEHLGGNVGRTFCLYAATGQTTVRVVGGQEQPL
jgi:chemotaxis protein CheD